MHEETDSENRNRKRWRYVPAVALVLIVVILVVPLSVHFAYRLDSLPCLESLWQSNDMLTYYGSVAGGALTLFGVFITVKYQKEAMEHQLKKRDIEFSSKVKPVIIQENYSETGTESKNLLYLVLNSEKLEFTPSEPKYQPYIGGTEFLFSNIGFNFAKNLTFSVGDVSSDRFTVDRGESLLLFVFWSSALQESKKYSLDLFYENLFSEKYYNRYILEFTSVEGCTAVRLIDRA